MLRSDRLAISAQSILYTVLQAEFLQTHYWLLYSVMPNGYPCAYYARHLDTSRIVNSLYRAFFNLLLHKFHHNAVQSSRSYHKVSPSHSHQLLYRSAQENLGSLICLQFLKEGELIFHSWSKQGERTQMCHLSWTGDKCNLHRPTFHYHSNASLYHRQLSRFLLSSYLSTICTIFTQSSWQLTWVLFFSSRHILA
jgi:hypothetical protein